jgi:hypothetical protein
LGGRIINLINLEPPMTPAQRKIIHNALGLLYSKTPYRNHFCASISNPVPEECVAAGWMERGGLEGTERRWYYVTEAGAKALGHELPKD